MKTIKEELEFIRKRNEGLLLPEHVVEFAKNKETKLHSHFQWDDSLAASQHRLWQARMIINVNVTVVDVEEEEPIRVKTYVSLTTDRGANGYRLMDDVMKSDDLRLQLMKDAQRELRNFREKYKSLTMLEKYMERADKDLKKGIEAIQKKKAKESNRVSGLQMATNPV